MERKVWKPQPGSGKMAGGYRYNKIPIIAVKSTAATRMILAEVYLDNELFNSGVKSLSDMLI